VLRGMAIRPRQARTAYGSGWNELAMIAVFFGDDAAELVPRRQRAIMRDVTNRMERNGNDKGRMREC